jgi:hypothetical protein
MFWSFSDDTALGEVTFNLDTTLLSEGAHQIKMFVYDPEGNKLMDMVTINVDNIMPDTPTIASIIDGQFIHGMFTFQVECDTDDLDSVDITITNTDLSSTVISGQTLGYNSASGYYELTVDTRALADGNYSVEAVSTDSAGTTASSTAINFMIDNNAPKLMVSSPLDNSMVSGDVDFEYMAEDPFLMGVMYKVDGNSWMDINITWDTTTYHDGDHMITIKAADYLGHESMVTLNLVVDNNGPTVAVINPFMGQFVMGEFTFKVAATDSVGVDIVEITLENTDTATLIMEDQAIPFNPGTGHYEYSLDTVSILDGNYTFSCISYDIFGQDSGDVPVDFMIDNNAPNLAIISPLSGDLVTGIVNINAEVSDTFLVGADYSVDGGEWMDISTPWDTSAIRDGMHTIDFLVTDEAGHETTKMIYVSSDNNGPSIFVVYMPADGSRVGSEFMIQLEVVDIHEIAEIAYTFGDSEYMQMFVNKETGFYEAKVVTNEDGLDLTDDEHDLVITATDAAGMSSYYSRNYTVDNTGPSITILSPSSSKVEGDVEFVIEVTDPAGVEKVYISINKGSWLELQTDASGNYIFNWNSKGVRNGKYDVDVKAEDTLGNEAVISDTVTVDNFPMIGFMIFLIVLILLIVLMVISLPRGKKSKSKAPKEESFPEPEITEDEEPEQSEDILDIDELKDDLEVELKSTDEFIEPPKEEQ